MREWRGVTGAGSEREKSVGEGEREERKTGRMFTSGVAPWHFHWGVSSTYDPFEFMGRQRQAGR